MGKLMLESSVGQPTRSIPCIEGVRSFLLLCTYRSVHPSPCSVLPSLPASLFVAGIRGRWGKWERGDRQCAG